ncbi:MAG: hypothetical protein AABX86_00915 [Nanoarchaeota archaeon]
MSIIQKLEALGRTTVARELREVEALFYGVHMIQERLMKGAHEIVLSDYQLLVKTGIASTPEAGQSFLEALAQQRNISYWNAQWGSPPKYHLGVLPTFLKCASEFLFGIDDLVLAVQRIDDQEQQRYQLEIINLYS